MLHLITGWETPDRKGEPSVLYCGTDRSKAQKVATEADPKFIRVEYAEVLLSFKWSRRIAPQNSHIIEKSPPSASPVVGAADVAPSASESGEGADGPELTPPSASEISGKKTNRR